MQIENGLVSGAWPYNAPIDDELTLDDLAWIYRNEKAPGETDAVDKLQG
ncbi:MAG: hypothetical protein PHX74_09365 [Candidatus Sumerlaeales bacterium]|nr:hypothetical protein [Candidatus Sumerlaeales bacterium]